MTELQPGDYARAEEGLRLLRAALGTIAWPHPAYTGLNSTALDAFSHALDQIEGTVATHKAAVHWQEATRPAVMIIDTETGEMRSERWCGNA